MTDKQQPSVEKRSFDGVLRLLRIACRESCSSETARLVHRDTLLCLIDYYLDERPKLLAVKNQTDAERLAEIRARCEKATQGPWVVNEESAAHEQVIAEAQHCRTIAMVIGRMKRDLDGMGFIMPELVNELLEASRPTEEEDQ